MFLVKNFILQVFVLASCSTRVQQFINYATLPRNCHLLLAMDCVVSLAVESLITDAYCDARINSLTLGNVFHRSIF